MLRGLTANTGGDDKVTEATWRGGVSNVIANKATTDNQAEENGL